MYRNNPLHTGVATDVVPPPLKLKWKQTFSTPVVGSPAVFGSRLYVPDRFGSVNAIDAATGNIIWSFNPGGAQAWDSSPAVATVGGQTIIFVGRSDNKLYAIRDDGATPFMLWNFDNLVNFFDSSPVVTTIAGTQVVIVGANDNKLYALVAATGALYPGWIPNPFTEAELWHSSLRQPF